MASRDLRVVILSDVWGYGLLETKPHPLWTIRYDALRNKSLLVPEYGVMYVAAFLKGMGVDFEVVNLVADVFQEDRWFREDGVDGEDSPSLSPIATDEALSMAREHLYGSLERLEPHVLLFPISIYYVALHARKLLVDLKRLLPGCSMVVGGVYATLHADEIMGDGGADFVVRGEGEWTTYELISALREGARDFSGIRGLTWRKGDGWVHNPPRERERDLDRFPHLYTVSEEFRVGLRHRLLKALNPFDDYIPGAGFLTSRGCPEECTFCLDPTIWERKTRFHSPEYVGEVLEFCWDNFTEGDRSFYFGDATFALNRKRLWKLLEVAERVPYSYHIQTRVDTVTPEVLEGLKRAGFASVALGAESLDDRILREVVRKRATGSEILRAARAVRDAGLKPLLTFIAGLPTDTRSNLERTARLLRDEGFNESSFFPLVVFRGTGLYREFKKIYAPQERERFRLNPWSEEFCFPSGEFTDMQELIEFTQHLNQIVRS
ncbi:MAG: radical SAM protein [Candidatus Geothermincolales bacterium]